jgi:predicted hydrolase (HD superfamily)
MLEYYCAYWSWEDNLRFTEQLVRHVLEEVLGGLRISWRGREIDFSGEWPRIDLGDLLREKAGIDIDQELEPLRQAVRGKGLWHDDMAKMGRGNLIDAVYKATARPSLVQPCFLTGVPAETLPLARRNDADPDRADCFQLLVNGWEIVKAYSELVDPIDQRARLEEQARLLAAGDEEAMFLDEEYLLAMEHGMPPISGWGMGIERFCALLSGAESLRDVTFFPLLRPVAAESGGAGGDDSADVKDFGLSREEAMALFRENVKSDYLTKHCLASAAVMEGVAERFGKDRDTYWCMGLLHDLDFDRVKEPDKHTRETVRILEEKGVKDPRILHAILSHNQEGLGVERKGWLDFALSCAETITGLVMATALVMPDRKLASVEPASVAKRMKKKDFAKQVSRENILQCERIGLPLDELCALAVAAMRKIAPQLGL